MHYYEIKPPPFLAPFIECFWSYSAFAGDSSKSLIVPDGCADILFKFSSNPDTHSSALSDSFEVFTIGQMTCSRIEQNNQDVLYAGIRINPGCSYHLFGTSMSGLTDNGFALEEVNRRVFKILVSLLKESSSIAHFFTLAGPALYTLFTTSGTLDPEIAAVLEKIRLSRGIISQAEIKASSSYSIRTIQRKCLEFAGYSPKMLSRVLRFRSIYDRIAAGKGTDMAALALDCGYYDQAHFNHDFKELSGFTPKEVINLFLT